MQPWTVLFAINAASTPNMKKSISFLYSITAKNAYVDGIFWTWKIYLLILVIVCECNQ